MTNDQESGHWSLGFVHWDLLNTPGSTRGPGREHGFRPTVAVVRAERPGGLARTRSRSARPGSRGRSRTPRRGRPSPSIAGGCTAAAGLAEVRHGSALPVRLRARGVSSARASRPPSAAAPCTRSGSAAWRPRTAASPAAVGRRLGHLLALERLGRGLARRAASGRRGPARPARPSRPCRRRA